MLRSLRTLLALFALCTWIPLSRAHDGHEHPATWYSGGELPSIPSNFDVSSWITRSPIPGPEIGVGAFRFLCSPSHLLYDDPIVYPGQPGAAHLHQFFGNTLTNSNSTYSSLRTTGNGTCDGGPVNRSAYWMPAMMNGQGSVVIPDFFVVYYKAVPNTAVSMPRGLRMVFGFPAPTSGWSCDGARAAGAPERATTIAAAGCDAAAHLIGSIGAPDCWDGRNLDSPDHRSHVAYRRQDGYGNNVCPSTHPIILPQYTMKAFYTPDATVSQWYLSSDRFKGANRPGGTDFHADWFGAWDDSVMATWMANCINKQLNCSAGELGDGTQLRRPETFTWYAPQRLVPIPVPPNGEPPPQPPTPPQDNTAVDVTAEASDQVTTNSSGGVRVTRAAGHSGAGIIVEQSQGSSLPAPTSIGVQNAGAITSQLNGIVVSSASAAADVTNSGTITSGLSGVHAWTTSGSARVDNLTGGVINAGDGPGVLTFTTAGFVSLTNSGTISSINGNGVLISAAGGSGRVENSGLISSQNAAGLLAQSSGGSVNVINSGTIYSLFGFGLQSSTAPDGLVTVLNRGLISGGDLTSADTARAVYNDAGNLILNNEVGGVVAGFLGAAPGTRSTYNNAGTFYLGGNSTLLGSESLNNSGFFEVRAHGTLDGLETFNNFGTVSVSGGNFAGSIAAFNNSGALSLTGGDITQVGRFENSGTVGAVGARTLGATTFANAGGLITMVNGTVGDQLTIAGNYLASGNARLAVDVSVGRVGAASDRLIVTGKASGTTSILINDTNMGKAGYNPNGIVVATVSDGTASRFVLASDSRNYETQRGVIDRGFFYYPLIQSGNNYVLYGLPDPEEAKQAATLLTGAQSIFYETSQGWMDHQSDLRQLLLRGHQPSSTAMGYVGLPKDSFARFSAPDAIAGPGNGVWAKAIGSWTKRDVTTSVVALGSPFGLDTSYKQSIYGIQGGGDYVWESLFSSSDIAAIGVMAGYVSSLLDFSNAPNRATYEGGTFGLSASYMYGNFFYEGHIKADVLSLDLNLPGVGSDRTSATTWGTKSNIGYRFDWGSFFVSPFATFAYARTYIGTLAFQGGSLGFRDGQSARAALGLQIGSPLWVNEKYRLEGSLLGRIWHEFSAHNTATLLTDATALPMVDSFEGTFGELKGELNLFSKGLAWSGFVNTALKINGDFSTITARGGTRYSW